MKFIAFYTWFKMRKFCIEDLLEGSCQLQCNFVPYLYRFIYRFTEIEGAAGRTFDWNPCTPFSTADGCNDVMVRKVLMKEVILRK